MKAILRVWQELDLKDIEEHLFVLGELSGECFRCHKVGLDIRISRCPHCQTVFKYIGFRRKVNPSFIAKFRETHPQHQLIDFDDFKKALSKKTAKEFLDI